MATQFYGTTVLRFRFEDLKWVNHISFEAKDRPVDWSIHYLNTTTDTMVPLTDRQGDLVRGVLSPASGLGGARWIFNDEHFRPVRTTTIEFHFLRRKTSDTIDLENLNPDLWYPIAVRNTTFSHVTNTWEELPPISDKQITISGPLKYSERLEIEDWCGGKAVDASLNSYWKSEPQPVGNAVVPLYFDVRKPDGTSSVLDHMDLMPVTPGPQLNIYTSNDDTEPSHWLLDRARFPMTVNGEPTFRDPSLPLYEAPDWGYYHEGAAGFMSHLNSFEPGRPFTAGLVYHYTHQTTGARRCVAMLTGGTNWLGVFLNGNDWTLENQDGLLTPIVGIPIDPSGEVAVLFGWTATDGWWLQVGDTGNPVATQVTAAGGPPDRYDTIYIGNNSTFGMAANGYVREVFVRLDSRHQPFLNGYATESGLLMDCLGPEDRIRPDFNGVFMARFLRNAAARTGAGHAMFEAKSWVPVFRDYRLSRGRVNIPKTAAKYIKFEFTNLVPQPYTITQPRLTKPTKFFPRDVELWFRAVALQTAKSNSINSDRDISQGLKTRVATRLGRSSAEWTDAAQAAADLSNQYIVDLSRRAEFDTAVEDLDFRTTEQRRFYNAGVHRYDERLMAFRAQQAYFVALHDVRFGRHDYTVMEDTPEYTESFGDAEMIASSEMEFDTQRGVLYCTDYEQQTVTKVFPSISKFRAVQIAVQGSQWESQFSDSQMSLVIPEGETLPEHIVSVGARIRDVSNEVTGEGAGSVLEVRPLHDLDTYDDLEQPQGLTEQQRIDAGWIYDDSLYYDNIVAYGISTNRRLYSSVESSGAYDWPNDTYDADYDSYDQSFISRNVRTSGVARIYLPYGNRGSYVIRLYSRGREVAVKRFDPGTLPIGRWVEIEVLYHSQLEDKDFQVEVTQIDNTVIEPFYIDFLAIFQNPMRWEVSNDGGVTWKYATHVINKPDGFISFANPGTELVVRITGQRPGAFASGFTIIPWYEESPLVSRIPIDYLDNFSANEDDNLRDPSRKPMFKMWPHYYPRRYSLQQYGSVPTSGQGIRL